VSVWGKQAETCHKYLTKGSKVIVEGRLIADETGNPRVYESNGKHGASFEVSAATVRFLSAKQGEPDVEF
jgi:single-strand DNA-binding protein